MVRPEGESSNLNALFETLESWNTELNRLKPKPLVNLPKGGRP
jgi:hypothetical protein